MAEEEGSKDANHVQRAIESTQLGLVSILLGVFHIILGASDWTKRRHIFIQAPIMVGVTAGVMYVFNLIGQFFFTTFWAQAFYASGVRLRLLPVPISLVIYAIIIAFFLLAFSLDSSIRNLQSEVDELQTELDALQEETKNDK